MVNVLLGGSLIQLRKLLLLCHAQGLGLNHQQLQVLLLQAPQSTSTTSTTAAPGSTTTTTSTQPPLASCYGYNLPKIGNTVTHNGITITASGSGQYWSETNFGNTVLLYQSCRSYEIPSRTAVYPAIGFAYSYTLRFGEDVSSAKIAFAAQAIIGDGGGENPANEVISINTSSGLPTLTLSQACFASLSGNNLLFEWSPIAANNCSSICNNYKAKWI